jgi:hypothetical protein
MCNVRFAPKAAIREMDVLRCEGRRFQSGPGGPVENMTQAPALTSRRFLREHQSGSWLKIMTFSNALSERR